MTTITSAGSLVTSCLLKKRKDRPCAGGTDNCIGQSSTACCATKSKVVDKECHSAFSNWKALHILWFQISLALASFVRFLHINRPAEVVFDEVHFGRFASQYIRREYFFDVHPPLGKMIFAGVAWFFGYDGWFSFEKIGLSYLETKVPFVAMRSVSALCGTLSVALVYAILVEMKFSLPAVLLGTALVLFDNGLVTQSRLILLDAQLILFILGACFAWIKFRQHSRNPFKAAWWSWLSTTGAFLGLALGVKFVGLFVIALVGICTIYDLWDLTRLERTPKIKTLLWHWLARIVCLIGIPAAVFLASYAVHFAVLNRSGTGDDYMSAKFQATLKGNHIISATHRVYYGSSVTMRSKVEGMYLHSHAHSYPLRHLDGKVSSQGQQVTGYPGEDENNDWVILPPLEDSAKMGGIESGRIPIKNGDLVRLLHVKTKKFLLTQDVASPLTVTNQEVSAVKIESIHDKQYQGTLWRIEINKGDKDALTSKISHFRLVHLLTGCALFNFQQNLPEWGFEQREINAVRTDTKPALWFVDDVLPPGGWQPTERQQNEQENRNNLAGFWYKFIELFLVSLAHNSILADRNPYMTSPWKWPFLIRGIAYWNSDDKCRKVYLLGNVLAWYFSLFGILIYLFALICHFFTQQRRMEVFSKAQLSFLLPKGGFFMLAYLLHYIPFFFMGRSLYFHHYLPCFVFKALVATSVFEFLSQRYKFMRHPMFISAICVAIVAVFYQFSILSYATALQSEDQFKRLKWFDSWHFIQ